MAEIREVLRLWLQGHGFRAVARLCAVDRKTTRRYIDAGRELGLQRQDSVEQLTDEFIASVATKLQPGRPAGRGDSWSVCERHREAITTWVQDDLRLTKVHELLVRQVGPKVPYRTLHRFVRQELGGRREQTTIRVDDCEPGQEVQIDFGSMGFLLDGLTGKRRRVWGLIFTAVYSRHQFVWLSFRQDLVSIIEGCEQAWAFFGGVFAVLIPDNMKAMVAKADALHPRFTEGFLEYVQRRGAVADPARVADPQGKARVERAVPYVREAFFRGETFTDLDQANERAAAWCLEKAGLRVHGTTRRRPLEVFETIEKPRLLAPPEEPYEVPLYANVKVNRDQHIRVDYALYSLPAQYIGERVHVRADRALVKIYLKRQLIKTHPRQAPGERHSDRQDFAEEQWLYATRDAATLKQQAAVAGAAIGEYARRLGENPAPWQTMRALFRLLGLVKRFGSKPVEGACRRALDVDVVDVVRVERLVEQALERAPSGPPPSPRGPASVVPLRFARPPEHFAVQRNNGDTSP